MKKFLPVDIETSSLDFNRGYILGIGYGETYNEGGKSLPPLPASCQNGRFEHKWLKKYNIPFDWQFDTLLAASILIDRPESLDLGTLASYYLGMESWKDETDKLFKKKNWIELYQKDPSLQVAMRRRNLYDLKSTSLLTERLQQKLEEENMTQFFYEKLMPAARMLAETEYRGMRIDIKATYQKLVDINQTLVTLLSQLNEWAGQPINFNSPIQLKALLKQKGYDLWVYDFKKRETVESTGSDALERLLPNEKIQLLLDYRKTTKLKGFLEGWLEENYQGRLFPSYNIASTRTGRLSCIEENQLIQVPGGQKPIKDIVVGEYVYCYDENNKVKLKKVLRVIDNGMQECVKVKWQSSGTQKSGELICTPDHSIKTKYKGWKRADELRRYDKIIHLKRSLLLNGRQRFYGTNGYQEMEEQVIKREYFNASSKMHIHHKDHNKSNNELANLQILSAKEHTSYHMLDRAEKGELKWKHLLTAPRNPSKGIENHMFITISKFSLLKKLAKAKGRPTYVQMDFETLKKKALLHNINLKEVGARYGNSGQYISTTTILRAFKQHKTVEYASKALGIGTKKLKAFCNLWGISYNHMISSVKPIGVRHVYDLEVEDCHNFIASELLVHNCSGPNLQQVPRDPSIRSLFIPDEGNVFVIADYAQIEPRIAAHYTQDEALLEVFSEGLDFYGSIACRVLGTPCLPNEVKKLYPDSRKVAKEIGLSILYGIGAGKLSSLIQKKAGIIFTKDQCQDIIKDYFKAYPRLLDFRKYVENKIMKNEILRTHYGRQFKIRPEKSFSTGVNTIVQATASDACLFSQLAIDEALKKEGIIAPLVAIIHDEVIRECKPEEAATVGSIMENIMINQGFNAKLKLDWSIGKTWGDKQ